jgi:hypothetical protein
VTAFRTTLACGNKDMDGTSSIQLFASTLPVSK